MSDEKTTAAQPDEPTGPASLPGGPLAPRSIRRGRPPLGAPEYGKSPTVRGVIPIEEFNRLRRLMERTGKGESELVRLAVHQLLVSHDLVE